MIGCCHMDDVPLSYRQKEAFIKTKWDCLNYGGEWINPDLHFDTTLDSMLTILTI